MLSSKLPKPLVVDKLKDAPIKTSLLAQIPKDVFDGWPLPYDSPVEFSFESKEEELDFGGATPMAASRKLFNKRKSESWDYKPGEGGSGGREPDPEDGFFPFLDESFLNVPTIDMISSSSGARIEPLRSDNRRAPFNNAPDTELSVFQREMVNFEMDPFEFGSAAPEFCASSLLTDIPAEIPFVGSQQLVKARRSEDWSSKPKLKRAKSMPLQNPADDTQKRRVKWTSEELKMLWKGILREGNNWKEISKVLTSRSYFQIKDKGRRLLFMRGWTTGRNKNDTDEGNLKAKAIARIALQEINKQ